MLVLPRNTMKIKKILFEKFYEKSKKISIWFISCILLWGIGISTPIFFGRLLDSIYLDNTNTSFYYFKLIFLLWTLELILSYLTRLLAFSLSISITSEVITHILDTINKLPLRLIQSYESANLTQRLFTDSSVVVEFLFNHIVNVLLKLLTFFITIIVVIKIDYRLMVFLICALCVYIIPYMYFKKSLRRWIETFRSAQSDIFENLTEFIKLVPFIKAHSAYEFSKSRISKNIKKYNELYIGYQRNGLTFDSVNSMNIKLINLFVLFYTIQEFTKSGISVGELTIINAYIASWIGAITYLINIFKDIQSFQVSENRLDAILMQSTDTEGSILLNTIDSIEIQELKVYFDEFQHSLNTFSYKFDKGKCYKIFGSNGSGKSTLVKYLLGLYLSSEQTVKINGICLRSVDRNFLRKNHISVCEQNPVLFKASLIDNVTLGSEYDSHFLDNLLLSFFGSEDKVCNIDRLLSEDFQALSGGEKQKVAIIRSLIKNPKLIIFDEPTSALDQESIKEFIRIIECIKSLVIVIVITHDNQLDLLFDDKIHVIS